MLKFSLKRKNISSKDTKVDFMMTIFSSIARRKLETSAKMLNGVLENRYKDGNIRINTSRFLGYDKDANGKIVINHVEAKTVKMIFNLYLWDVLPRNFNALGRKTILRTDVTRLFGIQQTS